MAVHFDFIVDDVDAENIANCISAAVFKCDAEILKIIGDKDKEPYIEWFEAHKKYLLSLAKKMTNTRVEE